MQPDRPFHPPFSRRQFLARSGLGLGALGLSSLMGEAVAGTALNSPLAPKKPHFAPKARHVIHLFMNGGPSQVDTFDPKPMLAKYAGKDLPNPLKTERKTGAAYPSPFRFSRYGQSGIEVSDIFSNV